MKMGKNTEREAQKEKLVHDDRQGKITRDTTGKAKKKRFFKDLLFCIQQSLSLKKMYFRMT